MKFIKLRDLLLTLLCMCACYMFTLFPLQYTLTSSRLTLAVLSLLSCSSPTHKSNIWRNHAILLTSNLFPEEFGRCWNEWRQVKPTQKSTTSPEDVLSWKILQHDVDTKHFHSLEYDSIKNKVLLLYVKKRKTNLHSASMLVLVYSYWNNLSKSLLYFVIWMLHQI